MAGLKRAAQNVIEHDIADRGRERRVLALEEPETRHAPLFDQPKLDTQALLMVRQGVEVGRGRRVPLGKKRTVTDVVVQRLLCEIGTDDLQDQARGRQLELFDTFHISIVLLYAAIRRRCPARHYKVTAGTTRCMLALSNTTYPVSVCREVWRDRVPSGCPSKIASMSHPVFNTVAARAWECAAPHSHAL